MSCCETENQIPQTLVQYGPHSLFPITIPFVSYPCEITSCGGEVKAIMAAVGGKSKEGKQGRSVAVNWMDWLID